MSTTVTSTEAARNLSDLLNRARYRGESFVIQRGGEEVARLEPPLPRSRVTLRGLVELLATLEPPDPDFWKDLEDIRANQPPLPEDPWGS
jgi:antitoxin (DNA-binding transcriptional repressor) of toxin-antitoxin stability system